jgi:hypothetical protein
MAPEMIARMADCDYVRNETIDGSTLSRLTTAHAHLRPHLSATVGSSIVPITPPVWNRPFIVDIRSVPSERVARSKYSMNDGCPNEVLARNTSPMSHPLPT